MTPPRVQRPPPDLEHVAVVGTSCAPPADDMLITRLVDKHMGVATPALASLIAAPADVECVLQGYAARDSRMESYSSSRPRIQALDQLMDFEDFEGEDQQPFGTIVSFLTIRDRILMSHTCDKLMDAWSLPWHDIPAPSSSESACLTREQHIEMLIQAFAIVGALGVSDVWSFIATTAGTPLGEAAPDS